MKCIRTANGSIMRVKDEEARKLVDNSKDYSYCSKSEYKAQQKAGSKNV